MEVADQQWRREWAGTAEYGKVTEGGVTRRIARAMEVLHASGPGARVRVMRAAYHSSAAPGAPAASFMLHSSRRVISSGFNLLESPSSPIKPLEISSTPFESSPEPNAETDNYKVTEPDDFEISEPSKWRGSTKGSSIRMPSEESSSTDNASIIDLDSRLGRNLHRKYSYDSECSDIQFGSRNSRSSPLLDTPVTLSTLKYKSLLNSSNEWNMRRKSYSFEDTSPLSETMTHTNDTLAMDSSTDSGICKSTEIVNDQLDDSTHTKYLSKDERKNEESFRDWLTKNRPTSHYRGTKFKSIRDHDVVMEDPLENNISLQSSAKVSITLPITIESNRDEYTKMQQTSEEGDRKVKRVEFCKTEVHFAAESGKVNIIATDEKPPPSNDFRKRRSAFVPLQDIIDKPITLFGERNNFAQNNGISSGNVSGNEFCPSDENTAATKSILKNKIPKPKPYLLGENMAFGVNDDLLNKDSSNNSVLSAVSLVNKQLKSEKHYNGEVESIFSREAVESVTPLALRTIKAGPTKYDSSKEEDLVVTQIKINKTTENTIDDIKSKFNGLQVSPAQRKPKTRQLRESELTYFGVDNGRKDSYKHRNNLKTSFGRNNSENIFQSVKLIQQVSNSVNNSEPESDEPPEYQNIPLNVNYTPVPTPRLRSKYEDKPNEIHEIQVFKPIIEKVAKETKDSSTRRTTSRRQGEITTIRSISAPPKALRREVDEKSRQRNNQSLCSSESIKEKSKHDIEKLHSANEHYSSEDNIPIYVNVNISEERSDTEKPETNKLRTTSLNSRQRKSHKTDSSNNKKVYAKDTARCDFNNSNRLKENRSDSGTDSNRRTKHSGTKDTLSRSVCKDSFPRRSEKFTKQHYASDNRGRISEVFDTVSRQSHTFSSESSNKKSIVEKKEHRSRSLQRPAARTVFEETSRELNHSNVKKADHQVKDVLDNNHSINSTRKRNSSRDKSRKESIKPTQKQDSNYTVLIPSAQTNNNVKDYGANMNGSKTNKRREYVINYDDKKGTVSSICKITPNLGIPKRKKSSKELFKDNQNDKGLKNKTVDKIASRNAARRSSRGSKRTE